MTNKVTLPSALLKSIDGLSVDERKALLVYIRDGLPKKTDNGSDKPMSDADIARKASSLLTPAGRLLVEAVAAKKSAKQIASRCERMSTLLDPFAGIAKGFDDAIAFLNELRAKEDKLTIDAKNLASAVLNSVTRGFNTVTATLVASGDRKAVFAKRLRKAVEAAEKAA